MKSILVILGLVAATLLYTPAAAETDCNAVPDPVEEGSCCSFSDLFSEEVLENCQEYDVPPPPHPHPHPHPHPKSPVHPPMRSPCHAACLVNQTNILNSEQKLDEAKLHEYLTATFKDDEEEWIPIVEMAFKTCSVRMEEMGAKWVARKAQHGPTDEHSPAHMGHHRCPFSSKFLLACAYMEGFKNCPSSKWNDNDQCNAVRDFVIDCPPQFHKRHGPKSVENTA